MLAEASVALDPLERGELELLEQLERREVAGLAPLGNVPRPTPWPFPWAASLLTLGVTGTNGKSSTTHLAASILKAQGHRVLTESTVGYYLDDQLLQVPRTIHGFFAALKHAATAGCTRAVVETTSAALAQRYAKLWRYDDAVFTNLTREHIEAHGSWEHYLASKAQLFVHLGPGRVAVYNATDSAGRLLDAVTPPDVVRRWYAARWRGRVDRALDLVADRFQLGPEGTSIHLEPGPWAEQLGEQLDIRFVGGVFAENALAAALGALAQGASAEAVRTGLSCCPPLAGRFEIVARQPLVAIDYAHTPDALEHVLATARVLAGAARVAVVFGAGGGSSRVKRQALGRAAGELADYAFVTSDNPRKDDPKAIANDVSAGARRGGRAYVRIELDRRFAIQQALDWAKPGDVVLVAGKGHERTQIIGDRELPFSDHEVVIEHLGQECTA